MSEHSQPSPPQANQEDDDFQLLRVNLLVEKVINDQLDQVVLYATESTVLLAGAKMKDNQLRNLLNVSVETDSIEVIRNFIRYQMGRSRQEWKSEFGQNVLDTITTKLFDVTATCLKTLPEELRTKDFEKQIYLKLTRLYLGYLQRSFYYADKVQGGFQVLDIIVKNKKQLGLTDLEEEANA
jgi:hypothetical protein